MLRGKKILLGITGGIAAYKTAFLVRLLIKAGAEVRVVLTDSAADFVSPLTLATLSKNPVLHSFVKEEDGTTDWNNHVELGLWADYMIIAPATANTMSKMATGSADNLLLATYLSAKCPVFFAPAMDLDMYKHPSTTKSFQTLESYGNIMIPAVSGELASGLDGVGRMAEPEDIIEFLINFISKGLPLKGQRVMITAGPTYEALDPVRFIGNHSSGLMGYELARVAAEYGAEVVLISGPSHLNLEHPLVTTIKVTTAEEMYLKAHEYFDNSDIVLGAAAVSDYKPKDVAQNKIKKQEEELNLELVKNKDILLSLGQKKEKQFLLGFALETENELEHAKDKLRNKNLDAIVLNSLRDEGAGFSTPTNKISFIDKNLKITPFELKSKADVAHDIWNEIINRREI